jgi:uncharacterized protein YcbX
MVSNKAKFFETRMPILKDVSFYPVKSLRGHSARQLGVERMGLENDRRFMLVDPQGMFLTQREHARMALITPTLTLNAETLSFSAPDMPELTFPIRKLGQPVNVEIWSSSGVQAIEQGRLPAEWLSDFLKMPVRLVRMAEDYQRKVNPEYAIRPDDQVGFADGFPILLVTQESLDDLNSRLVQPIPMNRFRPNLIVSGSTAFAEDNWKRLRIGQVELALVKPCARCNVPGIDQENAQSSREPSATLARYRKFNGKIMFGVNVIPISTGQLTVGAPVVILE